jgi:L-alanine-DL-glutamate epimerase-like enolase superfamily enzyme
MKITRIETRPLRIPYKVPFHWAQGVIEAAEVVLVCVHTDEGIVGYGESMSSASASAVQALLRQAERVCIGRSPFEITALLREAYQHLFAARGTCSAPRFGALVLAGLDMALWDIAGKACGRAVHELLGGAVRERIQYFGFPQGDTAEELALDARRWADSGCEVIYVKVGRGEALDMAIVEQVRAAIGKRRLRLDANEAWDGLTARRMIRALEPFGIEFLEQPTRSDSLAALEQLKASSPVPIAADQLIFTPEDVYEVCRRQAADLLVLGLHETGGIGRFRQAAAIAEAAGLNVCLHGLYETGITTCASHQVGAALTNLDDGNQFMNHLLSEDLLDHPDLTLSHGTLPLLPGPGLGFELNWDAVARAEAAYRAASEVPARM